ncbi:hypothetical protein PvtlMGM2_1232, partial [Prevotella sp. MGM2]
IYIPIIPVKIPIRTFSDPLLATYNLTL